LAHSARTWKGARTPSAVKRTRQNVRRRAINQPRRSAAKTLIARTVRAAVGGDAEQTRQSLAEAVSALDRAAKIGAIHPNAAARRKSRLMMKVNAAVEGATLIDSVKPTRAGKAAAAKATKARIAASRATKAKGEQTAAGKARAAIRRSTRAESAAEPTTTPAPEAAPVTKRATRSSAKTTASPGDTGTAAKGSTAKGAAAKRTTTKPATSKAASPKKPTTSRAKKA
jgi:small subunit ribosomal protein S20